MIRYLPILGGIFLALAILPVQSAETKKANASKQALQALNEFIGGWKGNGTNPKNLRETWKETVDWAWRFKKADVWLVLTIKNGRHWKGGELRFLPDKKRYQFTAIGMNNVKTVYEGMLQKGRLILERIDGKTKVTRQIKMQLAGGGIRFVYTVSHKPANRTLFTFDYQVACTKIGESFGAKEKKIECVVSGGLGTITVSHKGVTYYVCCSGCRDAFNENPEKYIKEYEEKKAKK